MKRNLLIIAVSLLLLTTLITIKREKFEVSRAFTHPDNPHDTLRNPYQPPASYYRPSNTFLVASPDFSDEMDRLDLPVSAEKEFTEWIDKGYLSVCKDQMSCGGCWAFAVTETLSARLGIATDGKWDNEYGLSPQYLISCGGNMGMQYYQGCEGGIPQYAIDSMAAEGVPKGEKDLTSSTKYTWYQTNQDENSTCAISPASACPCESVQSKITGPKYTTVGHSHSYTSHGPGTKVTEVDLWPDIPQDIIKGNVKRMKKALYFEGPFTVGIRVTQDFYNFRPTVDNYYRYDGSSPMLGGHAVAIVGWKTLDDGTPVWICKNSWGENWGYGFPDGARWDSPISGQNEIKYKGGFWNHIMGINDSFIESNAVGGHPNLKDPDVVKFLPNNGEKIPEKWYETMTLRDILNHHDDPDTEPDESKDAPTPSKEVAKTDFTHNEKKLNVTALPLNNVTLETVTDFFNTPGSQYIIGGDRNTFDAITKILPSAGSTIEENTVAGIIDKIQSTITEYTILGIVGSMSVKYWMFGDTNEWSPFNLSAFVGRTTDPNVIANLVFNQLQVLKPNDKVYFASSQKENFGINKMNNCNYVPFNFPAQSVQVYPSTQQRLVCVGDVRKLPASYGVYLPYTQEQWSTGEKQKLESLNWRLNYGRSLF